MRRFRAFVGLAAIAVAIPAGATAGQSSPPPAAQLGAGLYHTCALLDDGTTPAPPGWAVRCWGFSGDGQVGYGNTDVIGDNETPAAAGPVDLGTGRTARALAMGDYHSCAVLDNGTVRCWGYGNEGQLGLISRLSIGDNESPGSVGPINVGPGRTATAITAGGNHTCALLDDGNVRCWGLGEFGQLGYGGPANGSPPPSVGDTEDPGQVGPVNFGGQTAKAITAGAFHTCAILDDDSVRCWGQNINGQLGYGNTFAINDPSQVGSVDLGLGRTASAITAGFAHTCAILDDGSVRCWGLNEYGQLGYGNTTTIGDNEPPSAAAPVDLGAGRTAVAISAGGEHTCAVLDDGSVRCWGWEMNGQLGYGNLISIGDDETPGSVGPVDLGAGAKATAVAAGIFHTCARLDTRGVRCWGNGANGRLGLCARPDVGDDEAPSARGQVDIGAGGAACPASPPPPDTGGTTPPPGPAGPSSLDLALMAQAARAQAMRDCLAAARRRSGRVRRRARARCLRRLGRTPGRVATISAKAISRRRILLQFEASGTDRSSAPAARSYLVKQSLEPIRTRRDFNRAHALCKAACTFDVTAPGAAISLTVTALRPRTTYFYSVAARDNVSRRVGPRSKTVRARAR